MTTKESENKIKVYNIFNEEQKKIAEFVEFSDGWGWIHYIPVGSMYPYNEFAKAQSIKINITKNKWEYRKIEEVDVSE